MANIIYCVIRVSTLYGKNQVRRFLNVLIYNKSNVQLFIFVSYRINFHFDEMYLRKMLFFSIFVNNMRGRCYIENIMIIFFT